MLAAFAIVALALLFYVTKCAAIWRLERGDSDEFDRLPLFLRIKLFLLSVCDLRARRDIEIAVADRLSDANQPAQFSFSYFFTSVRDLSPFLLDWLRRIPAVVVEEPKQEIRNLGRHRVACADSSKVRDLFLKRAKSPRFRMKLVRFALGHGGDLDTCSRHLERILDTARFCLFVPRVPGICLALASVVDDGTLLMGLEPLTLVSNFLTTEAIDHELWHCLQALDEPAILRDDGSLSILRMLRLEAESHAASPHLLYCLSAISALLCGASLHWFLF